MAKKHIILLVLLLCFPVVICCPNVEASVTPMVIQGQGNPMGEFNMDTEFVEGETGIQTLAFSAPLPWIGGYMTTDYLTGNPGREPGGAAALSVTVSFYGTTQSVIQSNNALAAGVQVKVLIALQEVSSGAFHG